ncbi:MAG TPA: hypothetical protein VK456_17260 [Xanthobacteraceae bacterium]|nr:hypothetical protein [Xanthobacteraceae bacterium]
MKTVYACCAVLTFACCAPAASAPARTGAGDPFDGYILRPPAAIPHGHATRAAAAPLPRPKPISAPRATPVAAPSGPIAFPPVAPLE